MFITRRSIEQDVKSNNKYYSVSFSANSIDFKLLNSLIQYYKVRKIIYKGRGTDSLFIRVGGTGKNLLKLFNRYNKILKGLTNQEENLLKKIRNNSYVTKKYNFSDNITLKEEQELFKIYLPNEQIDYYDDYGSYHNQEVFYTKRIDYNKKDIKKDVISKTLEQACKLITDFKLSNTPIKNSDTLFEDVFNYRLKVCSFKLHNHYHRVKSNYDSYEEFIKYVVFYGANHYSNQRFWEKIKRELY